MPSARTQDPNGFLLVKGCPISSFGIFQYSAQQVGLEGVDPNKVINVFRPESAVNDPELIASLQNVPLINDHEMLSGFEGDESASAPEDYGVDGVLFDVKYQQPWLRGDVKVFTRSMQSDLAEGKADLSLGYTCDFLKSSGSYNGVNYDVIQTNMRGNHIALVGAGRVPGAKVLDKRLCFDHLDLNQTAKESHMPKRKALDADVVTNLREQFKALVPAFEQFLSAEAAEPAHAAGAVPGAAPGAVAAPPPTPDAVPPAAAAPAAVAPPAAAAPAAPPAAGGDPNAILSQLQALLAQLCQVMGVSAAPAAAAPPEGGEGVPPPEGGGEGGGETPPPEGGGEGGETPPPAESSEPKPEGENSMPEKKPEGDAVEGLNEDPNSQKINTDGAPEGQGTASPGPAAGKHTGADAALRSVYADQAAKHKLYDRLSKVVGAFDGAMDIATATAADVAAYGVKKLKLNVPKGQETVALDAYLTGAETARREVSVTTVAKATADAAASEVPAIAAYFKE